MAKKDTAKKNDRVKLTLIRSRSGRLPTHQATLNGLGLRKINQTVELVSTPEVKGMINQVSYLLRVEE